jgi:hypothetical protein
MTIGFVKCHFDMEKSIDFQLDVIKSICTCILKFTLNTLSLVSGLYSAAFSNNCSSLSNAVMPSAVVLSNPNKLFLWLAEHGFKTW